MCNDQTEVAHLMQLSLLNKDIAQLALLGTISRLMPVKISPTVGDAREGLHPY